MRVRAVLLAAMLMLVPLGARAADLVVWWEEGFNPAVRDIIAAFEQKTGKHVEFVQYSQNDMAEKTLAALSTNQPPDFLFGTIISDYFGPWAYEGRLIDLAGVLGRMVAQFDQDALAHATLLDGRTGRRSLYTLPMGRSTNHLHIWKSLLVRAGFTLQDIPKEWEPFWSFWCDQVQPALRLAMGRNDIWGVGLPMSAKGSDTDTQIAQFMSAYEANYVTRDGRLVINETLVRGRLIKALEAYTAIWRKGCTPPDAVDWDNRATTRRSWSRGS